MRPQRARRPHAALILTLQVILFFVFYQQMSTSLTLFALRNVDPSFSLFGVPLFTWSAAQFQALNPIWIMLLSPILAFAYTRLAARGRDIPVAAKYALGFLVVAIGFFVFGLSGQHAVDGRVSSWFMVGGYGLYSLGELLVSGLGLAMIARYVPARMSGFMMGAYFVATGVSQYLGSVVANLGAHARWQPRSAAIAADVHATVLRARLARGGRGAGRDRAAAVAEQVVA